jgi:phage/conjugal plasmid C-4 type zinc finger TraR family protein
VDDLDRAAEREQELRDDALRAQAARAAIGDKGKWQTLSAKWCGGSGCGERIPDERRRAIPGVKFCVSCKEQQEKGRRP